MNQPTQTATDKLLSPSMLHRLAESEETRKPIPAEELQSTLGELGVAASHDLPEAGTTATLRFEDGAERPVQLDGYTKGEARVTFPSPDGSGQKSNIHLGAFEQLTRETRNEPPK